QPFGGSRYPIWADRAGISPRRGRETGSRVRAKLESPAVKALFLTNKEGTPSTRWRILQLIPRLRSAGLQCDVVELPGGMIGKLGAVQHASHYDVVVLQKRLLPKLLNNRLRSHSKRLVFEFDDAVFLKRSDAGVRVSDTRERRFRRTVRGADAVVTPNEYLAGVARRYVEHPERVHVLPTAIDLARWTARPPAKREGPLTIGWVGTAANSHLLEIVTAPLQKVCRRHPGLELKVICDEAPTISGFPVRTQPYSAETEVEDIRSFDIAIAPQIEDPWTRGKVSTKLLAYFAAGLPTVASDVEAHRTLVRDGVNGFLAGTLSSWEERLEKLIATPELRDAVGAEARKTVETEYSLEATVPRYVELFQSLVKSADPA
ncbi:MAG TPA: glycosyltransferase family 4 protein, partial [Planctomycetota bacterium]|nr:glycosyltransferase family 4 protein [Planctomycetota bacterium]